MTDSAPTGERLLTLVEVRQLLGGIGESTFYRVVARDPEFPLPRRLVGKTRHWLLSEVEDYMRGLPRARERWWEPRRERKRSAA